MAHDPRALQRISTNLMANGRKVHHFTYASDHTKAEIVTAGYFNASRPALTPGSLIQAVADLDGTPNALLIRVATVPATGDVTVALDAPDAS